jgi:hypothetical protein
MVYFQTKKPTLGKIWRAFERKMLLNFITIWNFIRHLVSYKAVWYSLRSFGKFFPFWYVWTKKNLATLIGCESTGITCEQELLPSESR